MSKLFVAQISNICTVGAIHFDAKFKGMRKAQDFVVYPVKAGETTIKIQSDTRIGLINLETGVCTISASHPGGAYGVHLALAEENAILDQEVLAELKAHVIAKSGPDRTVNLSTLVTD